MARSLTGPSAQDDGERPARTLGQGPGHATLKLCRGGRTPLAKTARSCWSIAQGAVLSRRSTAALGGLPGPGHPSEAGGIPGSPARTAGGQRSGEPRAGRASWRLARSCWRPAGRPRARLPAQCGGRKGVVDAQVGQPRRAARIEPPVMSRRLPSRVGGAALSAGMKRGRCGVGKLTLTIRDSAESPGPDFAAGVVAARLQRTVRRRVLGDIATAGKVANSTVAYSPASSLVDGDDPPVSKRRLRLDLCHRRQGALPLTLRGRRTEVMLETRAQGQASRRRDRRSQRRGSPVLES